MAIRLIDPVVKDYLFHDAPLRSPLNKGVLAVLGAGLVVLAFFGWSVLTARNNLFEILLWVPYSILGSVLAYFGDRLLGSGAAGARLPFCHHPERFSCHGAGRGILE